MNVFVCGFKDAPKDKLFKDAPKDKLVINTTSRAKNWTQGLSPFYCGPVPLYDIYVAQNVENGWQYSKTYAKHVDENENPTEDYFSWAQWGWNKKRADRYPMGKGAKPLYSYWDGVKYDYLAARRKIYAPLYAAAVEKTDAFAKLKELYLNEEEIWLWDFDGYNHKALNLSYKDVMNNPKKKMGHAFVLAMLLESQKEWENI